MKRWGLYTLALVTAGCVGGLIWQDEILAQLHPKLALNTPAWDTRAQLNQQQPEQISLAYNEKFAELSERLDRLALRLEGLTIDEVKRPRANLPKPEQESLAQQITALNKRLARLEAQLGSNNESALFEMEAPLDQINDSENSRLALSTQLADSFGVEARDSNWATMMEDELGELLLANDDIQEGVIDYECRSTVCRATVQFDNFDLRNQSIETIPALLDGLSGRVAVIPVEGTPEVTIFLMD